MQASFHLHHNPRTDEQLAKNVQLRTYFTAFIGGMSVLLICFLIGVLVVDSRNEYETMVEDETIRIKNCVKSYEENKCHPHQRVPALNNFCLDLEICMNSDPRKIVKRSGAFSTIVSHNANKLFGNLTFQTILVICILLFGSLISCNLFLNKDSATYLKFAKLPKANQEHLKSN